MYIFMGLDYFYPRYNVHFQIVIVPNNNNNLTTLSIQSDSD